jgi:hypothetical protein
LLDIVAVFVAIGIELASDLLMYDNERWCEVHR